MKVTVNGVISRGVKACAIDDNGHLIFTMTDESTVDLGRVNGNGIVSITKTGTSGLDDTYTIAFDDDTSTTFYVTNGNGIASVTFKETDSQGNNVYTITFTNGTTAEFKTNRGPKGDKFTYDDFTPDEIAALKGDAGISVTNYQLVSGNHSPGSYDTYRMTLSDGTTFDCKVWNGSNGEGSGDMMAAIYDSHGKTTDVFDYVDNAIASIPTPDVSGQIKTHNESSTAHNDIRTGKQDKITASGLLKGDGSGGVTPAVAGTDYQTPLTTEEAQTLGIDATPTNGSNNLVTSGGVYTSLANKLDGIESANYPGCYYRMVGDVVEWLNPPMQLGVEYRTTERYFGKPIYVKLVDCGLLPASGTTKAIAHGISNVDSVIDAYGSTSVGFKIPYGDNSDRIFIGANINHIQIESEMHTYDPSNYGAYCIIKYTKTTD